MNIEVRDGYRFARDHESEFLLIESSRVNSYLDYANKNKIMNIGIYGFYDYKLDNVDFLDKIDYIKEIRIIEDLNQIDIDGLHKLINLEKLIISNHNQGIDFSFFSKLSYASFDWNKNIKNLCSCKLLDELIVHKFNTKSLCLKEIESLQSLKGLEIVDSNIESLRGIEKLTNLIKFEGYRLRKLVSLSGLEKIANTLKTLVLEDCMKINKYENTLAEMGNLEKLILLHCGEIHDLNFITKIRKLAFFSFVRTNVKDGDLTNLFNLTNAYIGFEKKRHYSHTMDDFRK